VFRYLFTYLFTYFPTSGLIIHFFLFIYLFILILMAYGLLMACGLACGHTPTPLFPPRRGEFCLSVNAKTASSTGDCIIIHYAVATSLKHHPVLTA